MVPDPIRLFHITAIDNLEAICQSGKLICKNDCNDKKIAYQNIAHTGAQGARVNKKVPNPPGGTIHDFVPFYFAPRSPMLSAIENGKVIGCAYRQTDILHFETTVPKIMEYTNDIVFYDLNATLELSSPYTDIKELPHNIAWDLITEHPRLDGYCKYSFNRQSGIKYVDRLERRMAEFLVKHEVSLDCMSRIGVANEEQAERVRSILQKKGVQLKVEIMTDWYFLGQ